MPKICAIPRLVSAPLNPITITEHFRSSCFLLLSMLDVQIWCSTIFEFFPILKIFLLTLCPLLFHSFPIQSNFKDNIWHKFSRPFFVFLEFVCFISIFHLWATLSPSVSVKRSFQKFSQQEMLIIWSSKNEFKNLNTEAL